MMPELPVKPLLAAVAALVFALPAWAQDAEDPAAAEASADPAPEAGGEAGQPESTGEEPPAEAPPAGEGEAAEGAGEEGADGSVVVDIEEGTVIDDQTFEGEEDDFIPSEEIPIDQAIPFPTDI